MTAESFSIPMEWCRVPGETKRHHWPPVASWWRDVGGLERCTSPLKRHYKTLRALGSRKLCSGSREGWGGMYP